MLPEIKNIIKSEAEKKFPESKEKHEDELSGEKFLVDINEGERLAYISGRKEGIEEMLKFVEWVKDNKFDCFRGNDGWQWIVSPIGDKTLTTEQLYIEYKKL